MSEKQEITLEGLIALLDDESTTDAQIAAYLELPPEQAPQARELARQLCEQVLKDENAEGQFAVDDFQTPVFVARSHTRRKFNRACIARYDDDCGLFYTGEELDEFDIRILEYVLDQGKSVELGQTFKVDMSELFYALFPHNANTSFDLTCAMTESLQRIGTAKFEFYSLDHRGDETIVSRGVFEDFALDDEAVASIRLTDLFVDKTFFPNYGNLIQKSCVLVDCALMLRVVLAASPDKELKLLFDHHVMLREFVHVGFPQVIQNACKRLQDEGFLESWNWHTSDGYQASLTLVKPTVFYWLKK